MTALHSSTSLPGPNGVGGVERVDTSMGIWKFPLCLAPFMSGLHGPTQVDTFCLQYALFAICLLAGGLHFRTLEVHRTKFLQSTSLGSECVFGANPVLVGLDALANAVVSGLPGAVRRIVE